MDASAPQVSFAGNSLISTTTSGTRRVKASESDPVNPGQTMSGLTNVG
jgi:hypothetical protein